jgi:hypothetical protein
VNDRAATEPGARRQTASHLVFANCAPADLLTACKNSANDPAEAEVNTGLELPPGLDEMENSKAELSETSIAEVCG